MYGIRWSGSSSAGGDLQESTPMPTAAAPVQPTAGPTFAELERALLLARDVAASGARAVYTAEWRSLENAKAFGRVLVAALERESPDHPDRLPVQVWVWRRSS